MAALSSNSDLAAAPIATPERPEDQEDGLHLHPDTRAHMITFLAGPSPEYPAVSKAFRAAHAKSPNALIASTLHVLDPDTAQILVPKLAALPKAEIESACARHSALVAQLAAQPSPGENINKYLQWCEDLPAAAPPVLRILVGTSMLPQGSLANWRQGERDNGAAARGWSTQLLAACTVLENHYRVLHGKWPGISAESDVDWNPQDYSEIPWPFCPVADVHHSFDLERYFALLEWMVEDHGRLRQLMAEFEGVNHRCGFHAVLISLGHLESELAQHGTDFAGAVASLINIDRGIGAFASMVALANRCDSFRMWAAS